MIDVKMLGPGFAAEVRGVGLADVAAGDEAYNAVRTAFEAHSVLLFRNVHRGRPWPDDQPRHMVRTTISATDADGLAEMWPATASASRGAVAPSNTSR